MFKIVFLTRYYRCLGFRYCARSLIKPVECCCTIQRTKFVFINHRRAYAEKKLGDTKSKKGEDKKITLKIPGLVHPESRNEELYYAEKSKEQLKKMKWKPDSFKIDAPDKKEK